MFLLLLSPVNSTLAIESNNNDSVTPSSGQYEKGYRYNVQGWIYLHIEGEPYERGYQHGYLLANEIVDMITRWSNIIHNSNALKRLKIDENSPLYERISNAWWNFMRSRAKQVYWNEYPDEYKEEIRGIADGVKAQGVKVHGRDVDYLDVLASNEMYELMTRLENPKKGFHPLRSLFGILKGLIPTGLGDETGFILSFLTEPPAQNCNGFIATGDATTHGQIVTSHGVLCGGWWYTYYIPQRWNVIIDIVPSKGYRFQMPSVPGYIWSDENYYQNEKGIILMDTTCIQGLWKDAGYPMAIRMRMGAQYSKTIDEALHYLKFKNDGIWTAVYLLGDTKTGEIARLDLGLYNSETWRTFNGFYWTANNPINKGVRAEINGLGVKGALMKIVSQIFKIHIEYGYSTLKYVPAGRDVKFEEMGKKYYGNIDVEILKNKIMTESPICNSASTDVKVSDTDLIKSNSLWVFFGNVGGMVWNTSALTKKLAGVRDVPPVGWALISGLPAGYNHLLSEDNSKTTPIKENKLIWTYDFADEFEGRNFWYANLALENNKLFGAGLNGAIYALDANTGKKLWENLVNDFGGVTWMNAKDDIVVVGWENGTRALDQKTGNIVWRNNDAKYVSSQPVFIDDMVVVGSRNGDLYALNCFDGKEVWHSTLNQQKVYPAFDNCESNRIVVAVGTHCYSINGENGNTLWDFTADGDIVCAPRVADDVVYVGSSDTHLYTLDAETGELEWDQETGWSICSTPAVDEDAVFVGSMDNHLYAFDRDNSNLLWSFACNAAIQSPPCIYGEFVFFGSDDGRFYTVNKSSGELVWCFAPGYTIDGDVYNYIVTPIVGNSVAGDKKVFISANGMIYGLDAQTFEKPKTVSKEKEITRETWFFVILLLVAIVLIAAILIYFSKKKQKK